MSNTVKAPCAQVDLEVVEDILETNGTTFETFWRAAFKWMLTGEEPDFNGASDGMGMRMAFKSLKRSVEKGRGTYKDNNVKQRKGGLAKSWKAAGLGTEAEFERFWLSHDEDPDKVQEAMHNMKFDNNDKGELRGKAI